jgi:hypothetical protein
MTLLILDYALKMVEIKKNLKSNRKKSFAALGIPVCVFSSVAEPHHFYAAPGENFDAAPAAPAPSPTLLYSKAKFLKRT